MASTSTINEWTEQLASSVVSSFPNSAQKRSRKVLDTFRRRLRYHNYARTNQFDVNDRLDGLQEKFRILNRDDISDALHDRRFELREQHERWIPDVLDLLLRLSDNPLQTASLQDLSTVVSSAGPPPFLKWADIEADDPFDRRDLIWRRPDFSDLSSSEDEAEASSTTTSPASVKQRQQPSNERIKISGSAFETPNLEDGRTALKSVHAFNTDLSVSLTEIQLIRQILGMIQGYPSNLFDLRHERVRLVNHVELKNVSKSTLQGLVGDLGVLRHHLDTVTSWIGKDDSSYHIQAIKHMMEDVVQTYLSSICALDEGLLHPKSLQIVSLVSVAMKIEGFGYPLETLGEWVLRVDGADSITSLDMLYNMVCECYFVNDIPALNLIMPIFLRAFGVYVRPVELWLEKGTLLPNLMPFFVRDKGSTPSADNLWRDNFELDLEGLHRAPSFFKTFTMDIFACGKTVAFTNHIRREKDVDILQHIASDNLINALQRAVSDPVVPFPAVFLATLAGYYSSALASATSILRNLLDTECGLNRTLDAFDHLFLRKQGVLLDTLEAGIFSRIDNCIDNWNDRFLIADMLEDIYTNIDCIDLESITVHSTHTSSRTMQSRRRSVRILEALTIDYSLPWPVANIISKPFLTAYRRISLHLLQIRRAKYVLDRIAYIHATSHPISENPRDQLLAQTTTFMFLQFANTLYDHFTTGVVLPMTTKMRQDLHTATTVDAMIAVHKTYITNLEFVCLTATQLKLLRETLIGLLDMCIRFADLVSSPTSAAHRHRSESVDLETGSFVSAQSRHRKKNGRAGIEYESSSDEDEDDQDAGNGYSSFIVLEEDTSVVQEIRKLQVQFRRQLDFFVAGLSGVGRGGGTVEEFEMLAARLQW